MKLSVQTGGILAEQGIDAGFRMIAEAGFDCVDFNIDTNLPYKQIASGECGGFFSQSDEALAEWLKPYIDAAAKYGVSFGQAHAPFPSYRAEDPAMTDYIHFAIEQSLKMCKMVGCPWLVVHPYFMGYAEHIDPKEDFDRNVRFYTSFLPAIRETGVKIATENMFSGFKGRVITSCMSDFEETARFMDTINGIAGEDLFGFCFDVGHAVLLRKDLGLVIRTLGKRITVLHVHDNDGINDQHVFPYQGVADWDAFCSGMRDIGYEGTLSFETFHTMTMHDPALAPALLKLLGETGRLFASRIEG